MARYTADLVMVLLGITSGVLLTAYGLVAANGTPDPDPVFWVLVLAFLVYIGWDVRRHIRSMRTHLGALERKSP